MSNISLLNAEQTPYFPAVEEALDDPEGLLAIGGALTTPWLLAAYQRGIFPWFNDGQPIMWWCPMPRMVLSPGEAHISKSLRKAFRRQPVEIRVNSQFEQVIRHCANNPLRRDGSWITEQMVQAYIRLHKEGWAHSFEVWQQGSLIGGLYGVGIDRCFFGESMFSLQPSASKFAFIALSGWAKEAGLSMIDCQLYNPYLDSLGASMMAKQPFQERLPNQETRLAAMDAASVNLSFLRLMEPDSQR